jgi:hypothetical protein
MQSIAPTPRTVVKRPAWIENAVESVEFRTAADEVMERPLGKNVSDGTGHAGNYSIQPRVARVGDSRTAKSRTVMLVRFG